MKIFKYEVGADDKQIIAVPKGAEPLCVMAQHKKVWIWMKVEEYAVEEDMVIWCHGTGHEMNAPMRGKYIGTLMTADETLVFHFFWDWATENEDPVN